MKRQQSKKRTIRTILLTIAAVILGWSIYLWNAESLVGDKLPMAFHTGASVVMTGSMEPCLQVNDLVVIRETDDYAVGDIVVFQDDGILIIHRIVEINGDEIITKGDANNVADAPITIKDIKGELVMTIPYAGVIVQFLKKPIAIILILAVALFLAEFSFRKEQEQDTDEIQAIIEEIRRLKDE